MTAEKPMRPAIVSISSHVVRGAVGNRCAVFVMESLGHPVWAIPTVMLPWHPGHGRATRIEPDLALFARMLEDLAASHWTGEIGAILTGYMANGEQAELVGQFVAAVKARHPGILYLCDPVIGDHGGLYVAPDTAIAIRDRLLPLADLATPNRHELAWLTGTGPLESAAAVLEATRRLGPATVLATSTPAFMKGNIANLLSRGRHGFLAEHRLVDGPTNGSGDLVAALFLCHILSGLEAEDALARTTSSIFEIVSRAAGRGSSELMPQADRDSLIRPMAMVAVRSLANPLAARRS